MGTLKRLLRHQEFDLIHAHHYEGLIAALMSRAGLPVVYDAHTLLASELPYYRLGLSRNVKEFLGGQLDLRLPAQAHHIIAVSEGIREAFVASGRIEDDRVSVIPNGVEAEHFAKIAPGISPPAGHGRLVFAGNLAPYQGIELLLHLLQEPSLCRRLGGNAQGLVASQYGWAQVAVKITAVYRRVLAAQRRAANA